MRYTLLYIAILFLFADCSTSKKSTFSEKKDVDSTYKTTDIRENHETRSEIQGVSILEVTDFKVIETVWTAPDTSGRQYPAITREIVSRKKVEKEVETTTVIQVDSTSIQDIAVEVRDKTETIIQTEEKKNLSWWRYVVGGALFIIVAGVVAAFLCLRKWLNE
jgi:hypothetical protein